MGRTPSFLKRIFARVHEIELAEAQAIREIIQRGPPAGSGISLEKAGRKAGGKEGSLARSRPQRATAFGIQSSALFSYTVCMKNFVVQSGDFIATSGIYRMNDSRARDHSHLRRCCADVPGKEGQVSAHPGCQKSQPRVKQNGKA